ncbi:phage tail tube protein [Paenibacillus sp. MMS18-CY102]|uniref:phage tail tube protein n=1 Tax=Paenibacillus sp. MMS18-CY102 TaxID=2682849 RepID=UPI001365770A|nr:phage tail tube protein [Paenibacillus sp. MMS18-CY102]MWC26633.1 terminase [Paenibacillus sp. MMS18-CY102]
MDKGNQVVTGNDATVWINDSIWPDVKSVEYKMAGEFEDITFLGDPRTYKRYLGFGGEGTLTLNKMFSRGASILGKAFKTGIMPDVKIVVKIANKSTGKSERAILKGVVFSDFGASTEAKAVGTEELPFTFSDYDILETL